MSSADQPAYLGHYPIASEAAASERVAFLRRTYAHLGATVLGFIAIETIILQMPNIDRLAMSMVQGWNWLIVMGLFFGAQFIAGRWASGGHSIQMQYAGLVLFTVAEAIIFIPILYFATRFAPDVIPTAAILTLAVFGGLTLFVLTSKKDFSFLRPALGILSMAALGLIVCSILFTFSLGLVFTAGVIVLIAGFILYNTSNVLHHYPTNAHVAAALVLFSSLATLFWYIIQLVWALQGED